MIRYVILFFVVTALFLAGIPAFAECRHLYRAQVHHGHYVQPVVHQNIFYSVGEGLVQQVKIEHEVKRQVREALQGLQAPQQQVAPTPTGFAKCIRCHAGESAKGGVRFDDGVNDAEFRRSVEILSGFNVPDAMKGVVSALQPADKGDITEAMLKSQPRAESPPPPPQPEGRLE